MAVLLGSTVMYNGIPMFLYNKTNLGKAKLLTIANDGSVKKFSGTPHVTKLEIKKVHSLWMHNNHFYYETKVGLISDTGDIMSEAYTEQVRRLGIYDYDFIKEFNKLGYDDKSANKLLRNMKMRIEMDSIEKEEEIITCEAEIC